MKLNQLFAASISLNVLTVIAPELSMAQGDRIQTYAGAQKRTGRAAIAAVIGKPVIMNFGPNQQLAFNFDSQTRVRVKRPAPNNDEIVGTITNDRDSNKVCFDFAGRAPATCDRLEFQAGKFMIIADNGRRIEGSAMMGLEGAAKPATQGQQSSASQNGTNYCDSLRQIVAAGEKGDFRPLIDHSRPKADFVSIAHTSHHSRVKMRGAWCAVEPNDHDSIFASHHCLIEVQAGDPKPQSMYDRIIAQTRSCLAGRIKSEDLNVTQHPMRNFDNAVISDIDLNSGVRMVLLREKAKTCALAYRLHNKIIGVPDERPDRDNLCTHEVRIKIDVPLK